MGKPSFLLCFLIGTFAIGSWIDINGVWVQTPLLVQHAPEKWNLPSILIIIIQVANVGPLLYLFLNKVSKGKIHEGPVIYLILSVGCLSCLLLAFFWNRTVVFAGAERSIPLICLTWLLATVDCTSSLVFLPYLASYPAAYMTALYVGEGFSGLLPGIVALIQGVGGETVCVNGTDANGTSIVFPVMPQPLFTVRDFFFFLSAMLLTSLIAFCIVDCYPRFGNYRRGQYYNVPDIEMNGKFDEVNDRGDPCETTVVDSQKSILTSGAEEGPSPRSCIVLLVIVTWINALTNGFLPSLQSYTMMPYGNVPYHLAVTLSNIVNPIACFFTFFVKVRSVKVVGLLTLVGTVLSGYMTYLAFMSPQPPLKEAVSGKFIMIASVVVLIALFSYSKAIVALEMQKVGRKYLTLCGFFTQFGSSIGAVSSFLIVNVFHLLQQAPPC